MDCFECGSCTFVCPANRPMVQWVKKAKKELAKKKNYNGAERSSTRRAFAVNQHCTHRALHHAKRREVNGWKHLQRHNRKSSPN